MNALNPVAQLRVRTDQRPLYAQASAALRKLVQGNGYAPGDRLPSEIELSHRLGISRPTLREALHQLEEEGAILRKHGVGTFVAESRPVIEAGLEILESVDRLAERSGLRTEMGDVVIEERLAVPRELKGLDLDVAAPVTAVMRVILADGQRIAHLTDIVPQAYLRQAELGTSFTGSVLDYLLARGWPALSHSRTELSTEAADGELARALRVPRGAPLLRFEAQLYTQDGPVADYSVSYFVPGHYRFHVVRRIGA